MVGLEQRHLTLLCLLLVIMLANTAASSNAGALGAHAIYVDERSSTDTANGSQERPYRTIQAGIDAARAGDTVYVAPGRYYENITMKSGVRLQGSGWDTTIIDGSGNGHVIYAGPSVKGGELNGFIITNSGSGWYDSGIWCVGCSLTVSHNKIDGNGGRGISAYKDSSVVIIGNLITNNGISGVYGFSSSIEILNNTIDGNIKEAGITVHNARAIIKNNIITNNPTGILGLDDVSGLSITYNNFWGNHTDYSPNILVGQGNISSDPLFKNRPQGDYSLNPGSPCIDAGDPSLGNNLQSGTRYDLGALEYVKEGAREPSGQQSGFPQIRALFDRYHNTTRDAWGSWFEENYPGQFTAAYLTRPLTYEELRNYDIFITYLSWKKDLGPRPTLSEAVALEQYIRDGGAALLMGDDPYWDLWTNEYLNVLSAPFGISFNDDQLLDPTDYDPNVTRVEDDAERHIVFHNLAKHLTTTGVNRIWAHGTCSLVSRNPRAVTIVAGDNDTYSDRYPGYSPGSYPPAVIALEHGSGRVIFSGGAISYGADVYDNSTFIWNILKWLAEANKQPSPSSQEIKFTGTATRYEHAPHINVWWVSIETVISGPQPRLSPMPVLFGTDTWQGYADPGIREGDKVEVYGEYVAAPATSVNLSESSHYIKRLSGPGKIDLAIAQEDITFSSVTKEQPVITIKAAVHNIGDADASNVEVLFTRQLGCCPPLSCPPVLEEIARVTIRHIAAGGIGIAQAELTLSQAEPSSTWTSISIVVDPDNQISEENKANNGAIGFLRECAGAEGHCPKATSAAIELDRMGNPPLYRVGETVTITMKFYSNGSLYDPDYVPSLRKGDCVCMLDLWNSDTGDHIHKTFSDFKRVSKGVYEVRVTAGPPGVWQVDLIQAIEGTLSATLLASAKYEVKGERPMPTDEQIAKEFMPALWQLQCDIDKGNFVREVDYHVERDGDKARIEYNIVFNDEDHPDATLDQIWDELRKLIYDIPYGGSTDVETFYLTVDLESYTIDEIAFHYPYRSSCSSQPSDLLEALAGGGTWYMRQGYDIWKPLHYCKIFRGGEINQEFTRTDGHIDVFVATWNHLYSNSGAKDPPQGCNQWKHFTTKDVKLVPRSREELTGRVLERIPALAQNWKPWCAWVSARMVLEYYGYSGVSEDQIGRETYKAAGREDEWVKKGEILGLPLNMTNEYFNTINHLGDDQLFIEQITTRQKEELLKEIIDAIKQGNPIIIASNGPWLFDYDLIVQKIKNPEGAHASVIVGYSFSREGLVRQLPGLSVSPPAIKLHDPATADLGIGTYWLSYDEFFERTVNEKSFLKLWRVKSIKGNMGQDKQLIITAFSPIDLAVKDPNGLTIDKQSSGIPNAIYTGTDINGDGDPDDQIVIPNRKPGDYQISVIPEPRAAPDDTYTLVVLDGDKTTVLAKDVKIRDIPNQPYLYKVSASWPWLLVIQIAIAVLVAILVISGSLAIYKRYRNSTLIEK